MPNPDQGTEPRVGLDARRDRAGSLDELRDDAVPWAAGGMAARMRFT
jgi:hypothetical protein